LGAHTCAAHGKYMQIWRVAVKRDIMRKKPRFTQCKNHVCGCGLQGKCGGKKPAVNFGWRYKFPGKLAKNSKRQFTLPGGSRKDQWEDLCLERVVRANCVKKLTYNEANMDSASAIFKRDVIDSPIDGCQSLTRVNLCTRFAGRQEDKGRQAQEVSKMEEEQDCQAQEEVADMVAEEGDKVEEAKACQAKKADRVEGEKEEDPFQEEERKLKWRWAENQIPLVGTMIAKTSFEDKWNMPEDRAALRKQLEEKMLDSEAVAKQYKTRAVEFADVDYPEDRRTFADLTEALEWLELKSNDL